MGHEESLNDAARRLCDGRDCHNCPLFNLKILAGGGCIVNSIRFKQGMSGEQIEGLKKWAEENPRDESKEHTDV